MVAKFIVIVIMLSTFSILLFPAILYLTTGLVEPMLPIMLPGIDMHTTSGYIILSLAHTFIIALAGFGFVASDLTFIVMTLYALPLSHLFIDHFDELNQTLKESPKVRDSKECRLFLRNIVRLHQELCS